MGSKLKKTVRSSFRTRQCSTGTVEANIHLMKRVYNKKNMDAHCVNADDAKSDRYLSPPHAMQQNAKKYKSKKKKKIAAKGPIKLSMSQSSTSATEEEELENFPKQQHHKMKKEMKMKKRRKKSKHSSEPLNRNKLSYEHNYAAVKYPNHEYRRRSRDDSELCNERLKLAAKSIERYIERKKREKKNADGDSADDSDAFPGVGTMSYRLFDL